MRQNTGLYFFPLQIKHKNFFELEGFRVIVEKRKNDPPVSEATVKIKVGGVSELSAGEGDGPVNALDNALRKVLLRFYPRIKDILPEWVGKPWRWMIPDDPKHKQQWLITWGEFILDFARVLNFHILDIQEISLVYPFQNPLIRKKLTQKQLVQISDYLVGIEKAKWWDDEKSRLRVYWKTLKSFTDELYEYAFQNGYGMVTAFDIVKMKQSWSTLPPPDVRMLMKLLVESKRALWADSEKKTIQFILDHKNYLDIINLYPFRMTTASNYAL